MAALLPNAVDAVVDVDVWDDDGATVAADDVSVKVAPLLLLNRRVLLDKLPAADEFTEDVVSVVGMT